MLNRRFSIAHLCLAVTLGALIFASLTNQKFSIPVSAEAQAEAGAAVPGGPGYLMVPAVAFQPESSTTTYTIFWGELSVPGSAAGIQHFYAPLNLPQGARLTGMTMYYHDTTSDTKYLGVDLLRKSLPGLDSGTNMGLATYSELNSQTGFGLYMTDNTPNTDTALVDNSQYSYWLSAYIYPAPAYLQLQAVRVDYTYNAALPAISR